MTTPSRLAPRATPHDPGAPEPGSAPEISTPGRACGCEAPPGLAPGTAQRSAQSEGQASQGGRPIRPGEIALRLSRSAAGGLGDYTGTDQPLRLLAPSLRDPRTALRLRRVPPPPTPEAPVNATTRTTTTPAAIGAATIGAVAAAATLITRRRRRPGQRGGRPTGARARSWRPGRGLGRPARWPCRRRPPHPACLHALARGRPVRRVPRRWPHRSRRGEAAVRQRPALGLTQRTSRTYSPRISRRCPASATSGSRPGRSTFRRR